jgi:tight adherence protein B
MTLTPDTLMMLGGGGGLAVIILIFALLPDPAAKALERRLKRITGDVIEIEEGPKTQLRRDNKDSGIHSLDVFIKTCMPNPQKLRTRLARTGRSITISEYMLITAVCVGVFYLLFHFIFGFKIAASVLLGVCLGVAIPHVVIGSLGKRRCKQFIKFFPESIDAMVRGIRSGLPIIESIKVVGEEMPDPIGLEFRAIADGVRMGRQLEDAMWEVAKRVDVPEYRYLIVALGIQKETGGNLAETLANVSEVLRRRRHIKLKIKAMSSEAKASAMILGALPFIIAGVLALVAGSYIAVLINDPRGHVLLGIAAFMMGTGVFIMTNMINFEI